MIKEKKIQDRLAKPVEKKNTHLWGIIAAAALIVIRVLGGTKKRYASIVWCYFLLLLNE